MLRRKTALGHSLVVSVVVCHSTCDSESQCYLSAGILFNIPQIHQRRYGIFTVTSPEILCLSSPSEGKDCRFSFV